MGCMPLIGNSKLNLELANEMADTHREGLAVLVIIVNKQPGEYHCVCNQSMLAGLQ